MVMTLSGSTEIAKWFNSEAAVAPTHFSVGTDSTTPNVSDSTLGGEVFRDVIDSQSRVSNLVQFDPVVTSVEATGSTLTEVGIFNSSSGGVIFSRNVFADLVKTDDIELQIENRSMIQ